MRAKPTGLYEVEVMNVTLEVAFDWSPAESETNLSEEYEITAVWIGDQDITDTVMAESVHEDIIAYLKRKRRESQMPKMYREELERIDRCRGSYRGFWPREVN